MRTLILLGTLVSIPLFGAGSDTLPLQTKTAPDSGRTSIIAPKDKKAPEPAPVAQAPVPTVQSIGTYGSARINEVTLKETLGRDLDVWIEKGLASDPTAVEMEKSFIEKIKKKFGFAFAEWSIIQYFKPDGLQLHLTLDVVEPQDVARRMPFLPEPTAAIPDPDGLIRQWMEYENTALDLVEAGELQPETDRCAALHCPFAHKHAKLKKYEPIFLAGVKKHAKTLLEIQAQEKHAEARGAATYLLAYWVDEKKKVVEAMIERTRDPEAMVRNNALRVLGDIAEFHPDVTIPLSPIVAALDYPRVSDRSKALYVTLLMALNSPSVRDQLLKTSIPTLIALMECKQPDHRELAHNILRKVSGKDLSATDTRPWLAWYRKLPQGREVSKK